MIKRISALLAFFPLALFAHPSFMFEKEQVAAYNKHSSQQLEAVLEVLDSLSFSESERILDVGCGDGKITALLAKKMPQSTIVGCDVSKAMINFASKNYLASNLSFIKKDACKLGFKEEFDKVVSFSCLHWINDQKKALSEIYASLKPGGKAMLVATPRSQDDDLQFSCGKLVSSEKWAFYFQNYPRIHSFHTEEEYQQLLKATGFTIDKIHQSTREIVFENRQSFENWITPVLTPMHHLHEKNRRAFLNDLFAELQQRECIDEEGKVHLHIGQIELIAAKPLQN